MIFQNETDRSGSLVAFAGALAAWLAIGAVMWSAYASPQVRPVDPCQWVCRPPTGQHSRT